MDDWFEEAHQELVDEYLEEHPHASDEEAYRATADGVSDRMTDNMAAAGDAAHDRMTGDR